jgi:membrane protein DedA with SNARE-associated domain
VTISSLVEQYGYWAVFAGTFFEGETVLLVAGFAAHRGLLKLHEVILVAFAASTFADQLYFFAGRRYGERLLVRFPALRRQVPRVDRLLARYHTPLILSIRFLYGLRVAGPIIMGARGVSPVKFAALNVTGAVVWAALIAGLGYQFGNALDWLLHDVKLIEEAVLAGILVVGLAWSLVRFLRSRRLASRGPIPLRGQADKDEQ